LYNRTRRISQTS
nr:Chain C, Ryanodine receptor 2 [Mus musculus]